MNPPRLSTEHVSVTFGRNRVLRDVGLTVGAGEIHALIGQNGSGKSTLVKVLTGLYVPEPGARAQVDGVALRLPVRPREARASGVAVVHQSLGLVPAMTVLENMRVGRLRARRFSRRIRWAEERDIAGRMFERLGRSVPLDAPVGRLSEEDRATVAIARALQDTPRGGGLIIFDESTRPLSRRSLEHFYGVLDAVVREGTSALLITHRLEEVVEAADRVTVLRDGEVVEAGATVAGHAAGDFAELMLGRVLARIGSGGGHARGRGTPAVALAGVRTGRLRGVDLRIAPGEVVGVTGLADSGYEDLPYVLAGAVPALAGTLDGRDLRGLTPAAAIARGIALVPGDRERAGLATDQTVAENAALPGGRGLAPLARRAELARIGPWLDRLDLRPRDPHAVAGRLSGGNQQKVVLAKWLAREPTVLALHEPTQAVDVGARETIIAAIRDAAATGCAVLVAGGDESELSMLCDRILVLSDGRVTRELTCPCGPDDIVAAICSDTDRRPLRAAADEKRLTP